MKKRILFGVLAVVLAVALTIPMALVSAHEEEDPYVTDLLAGQFEDVGDVKVWNDGDNLYITYEITDLDWTITETHLYVGKNVAPTTAPGQFPYDDDDASSVSDTTVTYTIPLDDIDSYSRQLNKKGKPTGPMIADGSPGVEPCNYIYIAAHAVVEEVIAEAPYYAASVDSYWQGTLNNGNPIPPGWNRNNPEAVLALDDPPWFFSLGFGEDGNGWIIVEFDCPIRNGDGNDVQVVEVTNADPYPSETADVLASQDGSTWVLLGEADNRFKEYPIGLTATDFDLGPLPWAKYIKVQDTSDPTVPWPGALDAFDLEAIISLQDCIQEETAWGGGFLFEGRNNWAMHFPYHVQPVPCMTPSGSLTITGPGSPWKSVSAWCPCAYTYDLTEAGEPIALQGWVDLSEAAVANTGDWSKYFAKFSIHDSSNQVVNVVFANSWLGTWYEIPPHAWDRISLETENVPGLVSNTPHAEQWYAKIGGVLGYDMDGYWVGAGDVATVYPSDGNYLFQLIADPVAETFTLQVYGMGSSAPVADPPPTAKPGWPKQNMYDDPTWLELGTITATGFDFSQVNICAILWASTQAGATETTTIYWDGMTVDTPVTFGDIPE